MSKSLTTDNFEKHTVKSSLKKLYFLQKFLINNFYTVLSQEISKLHPNSILDAGCGEGFILHHLEIAKIGKKLSGFDFMDDAINIGKKQYPTLDLKKGDIYHIDAKSSSYDVVLCSEVLEHLERPEEALKELIRVSKKYVVLSVPHEPYFMLGNFLRGKNVKRFGNDIDHVQHWTNKQFGRFVSKYLTIKSNITPLPWTLIIAQKK